MIITPRSRLVTVAVLCAGALSLGSAIALIADMGTSRSGTDAHVIERRAVATTTPVPSPAQVSDAHALIGTERLDDYALAHHWKAKIPPGQAKKQQ